MRLVRTALRRPIHDCNRILVHHPAGNPPHARMVVDQEVYTEYQNVRVAQDKIALAQKSADEAKKNLAFAEGRYSARAGNVIELTDAELLAATTQSLVEARYAYQVLSAGCRWLARRIRSIRKGGRTAS